MGKEHFSSPSYSLPIEFEHISNVLDDRFMKVKVWIAHTGENRNRSIFTREVLESMIPSLANVPILGYIAQTSDGEDDFHGHEERLVVENNEFKIKYVGRAYGLVPETNNARFESRYGEDGVEREYLVADALIWRKFPEVEQIFDRDGGFKSQSMEIYPASVKGYANEEGVFVFEQAKFEGLCVLGEGVTPAMVSSTIEKFSFSEYKNELKEILDELWKENLTHNQKGDETVPNQEDNLNQNTEPVTEPTQFEDGQTQEPQAEPQSEPATEPVVEPEQSEGEGTVFTEGEGSTGETPEEQAPAQGEEGETNFQTNEDETPEGEEKGAEPAKFTRTFELSHDDIRWGLYDALDNHESFKDNWMWISKVYDSHAIVENEGTGQFFKINYVKHENAVSLGEYEELFPMFLTATEKSAVDASRNNFEALEQEVKNLREFKENIVLNEKEAKLAQYSSMLTQDEYTAVKDNLKNFSMEDMEKEIGVLLLRKNQFSATKQAEETAPAKVGATNAVESNPYGSASIYFSK